MKLLLTHGYFLREDPAEQCIMKPYPPLGLLSISAWLTREQIENEVFDTTFQSKEKLMAYLGDFQPDVVGFYVNLMTRFNVMALIGFIRNHASLGRTKIIIGGPDARHQASGYLSLGADFVIPGEGEETFTLLIKALIENEPVDSIRISGTITRDANGNIGEHGERKLINPALLPFPARDKIDLRAYLEAWKTHHGFSSVTLNTMRGCPYSCSWCSKSVFGNTSRRRDPVTVVREMKQVASEFHPDQLWFTDDVFTLSREWLNKFCLELENERLLIPYECISRSDCLDKEILTLLKRSGCRKLWVGAESGSQKVIDLMNRRIEISGTIEMIRMAKEMGIETGTFIMLGYPGETMKDILLTARYLKDARPDEVTVGLAYPIKGTKFFIDSEQDFLAPYKWELANERKIKLRRGYSDRFYRFASGYLWNTYRALDRIPGSSLTPKSAKNDQRSAAFPDVSNRPSNDMNFTLPWFARQFLFRTKAFGYKVMMHFFSLQKR